MKIIDTEIEGVKIIEPDVFGDNRGWFCETYNAERYCKTNSSMGSDDMGATMGF